MKINNWLVFLILLAISLIFYSDAFSHYFYQDDFYHFYISRTDNIWDFLDFFNPVNKYGYQIYRPLSTQVFFFLYQNLFGLSHTIFQIIVLGLLSINSFLIYKICRRYSSLTISILLAIFYLVHHQNIGIVYYLSTIQTSLAVLFTLLGIIQIQNKPRFWKFNLTALYLLSLFCHEITIVNSIIFSLLIIVGDIKKSKKEKLLFLTLIIITILFLFFKLKFLNTEFFDNTHYALSFNPRIIINNLMWYGLWLLSFPEYIINFIGSGFKPLPQLFGQYRKESLLSFAIVLINGLIYLFLIIKSKFKIEFLAYFVLFIIALAPILLFPWHKYTYYLPIASVFIIIFISKILTKSNKTSIGLILLLIITAITTNFIDRQTSYNFRRGKMSAIIREEINLQKLKQSQSVLIANDPSFEVFSKDWGSTSSQAKIVLRDGIGLRLLSQNPNLRIYFEDDLKNKNLEFDYQFEIKKEWQ